MAITAFKSTPVSTAGDLPAVDAAAPAFELVGVDLSPVTTADFAGHQLVLNIFPSIDTGTCARSVQRFNELAAGWKDTRVLCVSKDLPFALTRFCGAEGIDNVTAASAFRSSFGEDFGLTQQEGPLAGLLARAVVVLDAEGTVTYRQLVPEITSEPDYDAVLAALA